ncbi:MAG: alpha/beta hydrolase [Microbacterium sp.]
MTGKRARRIGTAIVALAAGAGLLTGCVSAFIPVRPADPAPVTDGVPDELLDFYDQPPEWSDCGENLECATITAPLDWDDPDRGEIDLALTRYLAEDGAPQGSLLTNPGGPGASGVSFVQQAATSVFDDDVAGAFDIVGFDPRGVGDSTAVTCLDAEDMDAYLYDVPEAERGTPEWESEVAEGNRAFIDACTENTGELLEFITTEQAARDLDLIRAVLGEEKLRYLGFSYGTFLGATYAGLFPERAGSLVLDAAIDPSVPSSMVGAAQGVGFEDSLRAYLSNCEQAGQCPFPGSVDDGMSDLAALLADVDRSPVAGPDGRELGADTLVTAIISSLYSPASWPQLTQALTGVQKGDATAAFLLADAYNSRTEGGYMDNSTEAFSAYNCMDYPVSTEAEEREAEQLVQEKAPTVAPYWFGPDLCEDWPYPPTGTRGEITAEGADPILVVGTTGDPATPYAWAESLADQLSSGTLLTYEGEGHSAYGNGSACIDDAVGAFLLDGEVPKDGLTCR